MLTIRIKKGMSMQGIIRFTPSVSGYTNAATLAVALGFNEHYFTDAFYKRTKFAKGIEVQNFNGHWMAKIPTKYYELLDKGYTAMKLNETNLNEVRFDEMLQITKQTIIGFCK
jgi:hypothetical protein